MSRPARMSSDDVTAALQQLTDWDGDADAIERTVECPTFPAAITLVGRVADVAEEMNHHPAIDIRWRKVRFALSTHDAGGVTSLDVELATQIDKLAGS